MGIIISGINLPVSAGEEEAIRSALTLAGVKRAGRAQIARRSVDARRRGGIKFCYSVYLELPAGEEERALRPWRD